MFLFDENEEALAIWIKHFHWYRIIDVSGYDDDREELKHLDGICCDDEEINKKLKIFRSDPFDYHSIVDALRGCSGLFYTFEPPQDQPIYDVRLFYLFNIFY